MKSRKSKKSIKKLIVNPIFSENYFKKRLIRKTNKRRRRIKRRKR